jgi:hypothetical protein
MGRARARDSSDSHEAHLHVIEFATTCLTCLISYPCPRHTVHAADVLVGISANGMHISHPTHQTEIMKSFCMWANDTALIQREAKRNSIFNLLECHHVVDDRTRNPRSWPSISS